MKLKMKLTASSIKSVAKELEKYAKELPTKAEKLEHRVAEIGVDTAKKNVLGMARYGNLLDIAGSINTYQTQNGWRISTTNEKAPYVEFGTGVKGANSSHELANDFDWEYEIGSTIGWYHIQGFTGNDGEWINGTWRYGWWYPSSIDDPNPIKKMTENGEWWAFTSGMVARPFMYNTARELREQLPTIAREIFSNDSR